MIKGYIENFDFKEHIANIAEVIRNLEFSMHDAPNAVERLKQPRKHPTAKKVETIKNNLEYIEVI